MTTRAYLDWQYDQIDCECEFHRYHIAHFCACGKMISHSQGSFNQHKFHDGLINFDSFYYKHGDKPEDTWDRLHGLGLLPYSDDNFQAVYLAMFD